VLDATTLLQRCRAGDDLAWEALVRLYQGRVYSVAWHYLRSPAEAQDMAQEIFVRIYQGLDTFRGEEAFLPWMLRLARNACLDALRRRKARPPLSDIPIQDVPEIPAPGPGPEEARAAEARRALLYRALDRMGALNREMILLKEIQGLKLEEIAGLLALPLGTVKSRSNRARLELASQLRLLDPTLGAQR